MLSAKRSNQANKENIAAQQRKKVAKTATEKFYLIVELDTKQGSQGRYEIITGDSIVNIPLVNYQTVYTGKKVQFRGNLGKIISSTCVTISTEILFVEAQLDLISNCQQQPPIMDSNVLNTNKMNVLNGKPMVPKKEIKLPKETSITMKRPKTASVETTQQEHQDVMMDINYAGEQMVTPKPMMYDQQSQTDAKLYESLIPGSAAQIQQQQVQISQLIRVNNAILKENQSLTKMFAELQEQEKSKHNMLMKTMKEMNRKLDNFDQAVKVENVKEETFEENGNRSSLGNQVIINSGEGPDNSATIEIYPSNEDEDVETYVANFEGINYSNVKHHHQNISLEFTPPIKKDKRKLSNCMYFDEQNSMDENDCEVIGPGGTKVPKFIMKNINWGSHSSATRRILMGVFDRQVLSTHSLTGKPSPAFLDRTAKMQLDPNKIRDIVDLVAKRCNVSETLVRSVITSKCADENKMMRQQSIKHSRKSFENKENE